MYIFRPTISLPLQEEGKRARRLALSSMMLFDLSTLFEPRGKGGDPSLAALSYRRGSSSGPAPTSKRSGEYCRQIHSSVLDARELHVQIGQVSEKLSDSL